MHQVLALPTTTTRVPMRRKNVAPWIRMHRCHRIWGHGLLRRFVTNTTSQSSPIHGDQTATCASGAAPPISQAAAPTPRAVPPSGQATTLAPSTIPPSSQATTLAPSTVPPGINPSTPPRLNASGISGVTDVGTDSLDNQGTSMSVGGSHIPQ